MKIQDREWSAWLTGSRAQDVALCIGVALLVAGLHLITACGYCNSCLGPWGWSDVPTVNAPEAPGSTNAPETGDSFGLPEASQAEVALAPDAPIFFDFDSAVIRPDQTFHVEQWADWLKLQPAGVTFSLSGHADERGAAEYNLALSDARAQAVKKYLTTLGVPAGRLAPVGYGEETPTCISESCYQLDRRVDVGAGG